MPPKKQAEENIQRFATLDELTKANIETITRIEAAAHEARSTSDVVAVFIGNVCGQPAFVVTQAAIVIAWICWNAMAPSNLYKPDPPPYTYLTLALGVEAILLSTFVLISQNRQQHIADRRNHLDLQINMLAEQETSQMLSMLKQIMAHLDMPISPGAEVLGETTNPERMAEQLGEALDSSSGDDKSEG